MNQIIDERGEPIAIRHGSEATGMTEAREMHDREQRAIVRREASEAATHLARAGKAALETASSALRRPTANAALIGATVTGAALIWGVGPTLFAAATGYAAYRALRARERRTDQPQPA